MRNMAPSGHPFRVLDVFSFEPYLPLPPTPFLHLSPVLLSMRITLNFPPLYLQRHSPTPTPCVTSHSLHLPELPLTRGSSDQTPRCDVAPMKGFVYEVLRRSRMSGSVLQRNSISSRL